VIYGSGQGREQVAHAGLDVVADAADIVVTMGCGDACPVYPGRRYLDWGLEDPAGLPLARVRGIRDDIEARVRDLLASLS
jgi:arsenate reductase